MPSFGSKKTAEKFSHDCNNDAICLLASIFYFPDKIRKKCAKSVVSLHAKCAHVENFSILFLRYVSFILHIVKGQQKQHVVQNHKSRLGILNNFLENHPCPYVIA